MLLSKCSFLVVEYKIFRYLNVHLKAAGTCAAKQRGNRCWGGWAPTYTSCCMFFAFCTFHSLFNYKRPLSQRQAKIRLIYRKSPSSRQSSDSSRQNGVSRITWHLSVPRMMASTPSSHKHVLEQILQCVVLGINKRIGSWIPCHLEVVSVLHIRTTLY